MSGKQTLSSSFKKRLSLFEGRSVFVTGHTGFKGSWLSLWLSSLGARVTGYALAPPTDPSNFEASRVREVLTDHVESDVRDLDRLRESLRQCQPDVVFHLAAQPLVRESYRCPLETFETNVMGTANLLEAVRTLGLRCAVVIVTSDKCYENFEWQWGYRESDRLGGRDPYSGSKGAAELVTSSYHRSFFPVDRLREHGVAVATARAGNVIGGGDWSADHIIVDSVAALNEGRAVPVRSPNAIRPWQHVLESLSGYLTLASCLMDDEASRYCGAWNFGPDIDDSVSVSNLVQLLMESWGSGEWEDASDPDAPHEAGVLRLCIDKARTELGWRPRWDVKKAIETTAAWYRSYFGDPTSARRICMEQIEQFVST
jgi:CDP-glucose 4,6-dehydratase